MTPVQHDQQQRCVAAKEAMFEQLMGELQGALADGGPGDAIEVCSMRAPEIAAAVANQHGVRIGRTSFKLRNQANLPPDWAEPLVAERVAEATWLAGPDGELAGLLPIRLKAPCVTCHGPRDELPQPVQAALADLYPADEATGFAPGDLRGWFWVEAPTES